MPSLTSVAPLYLVLCNILQQFMSSLNLFTYFNELRDIGFYIGINRVNGRQRKQLSGIYNIFYALSTRARLCLQIRLYCAICSGQRQERLTKICIIEIAINPAIRSAAALVIRKKKIDIQWQPVCHIPRCTRS